MQNLLEIAVNTALRAGVETLKYYYSEFKVELKADKTPVTEADIKANEFIIEKLTLTQIPIISEEGINSDYEARKYWEHLWLVDPIDGTKEFIKHNGEYTVNIALIENNYPIIGVIFNPVFYTLYFASSQIGAYKADMHFIKEQLEQNRPIKLSELILNANKLNESKLPKNFTIVASRSHLSKEVAEYIKNKKNEFENIDTIYKGSSLKFCLIAEGQANAYPRYGTTMEWDTAAGQCIAEQAGALVFSVDLKQRLKYNKPDLKNPNFVVERF
ncbi:MAG: 3'(2'),5'-bisphosphate nucleotidase CysQ [Bacteroidetes bacterium]|nr:3'(2'),5'-bisphosphate nucleotidase CysQ [Bacteroidota bacterium]